MPRMRNLCTRPHSRASPRATTRGLADLLECNASSFGTISRFEPRLVALAWMLARPSCDCGDAPRRSSRLALGSQVRSHVDRCPRPSALRASCEPLRSRVIHAHGVLSACTPRSDGAYASGRLTADRARDRIGRTRLHVGVRHARVAYGRGCGLLARRCEQAVIALVRERYAAIRGFS